MGRHDKLLEEILLGRADANVDLAALRQFQLHLGFTERVRGSHHRRTGVVELINLQRDGPQAEPYQVRLVRNVILRYGLRGKADVLGPIAAWIETVRMPPSSPRCPSCQAAWPMGQAQERPRPTSTRPCGHE